MSYVGDVIEGIDWALLREQKDYCVNEAANNHEACDIYKGLVHLLHDIQDAAASDGYASSEEIFGALKE